MGSPTKRFRSRVNYRGIVFANVRKVVRIVLPFDHFHRPQLLVRSVSLSGNALTGCVSEERASHCLASLTQPSSSGERLETPPDLNLPHFHLLK